MSSPPSGAKLTARRCTYDDRDLCPGDRNPRGDDLCHLRRRNRGVCARAPVHAPALPAPEREALATARLSHTRVRPAEPERRLGQCAATIPERSLLAADRTGV